MIRSIEIGYPVLEIFDSIQGEGSMIGMPVTFIRLLGCNLKCPWCDTKESHVSATKENFLSIEAILERCKQSIVVITGGEPCLQDLVPLIASLQEENHFVCLETNGTQPTPKNADYVTASPKPPEYFIHEDCNYQELKYVVCDHFNVSVIPPGTPTGTVWLQPEGSTMAASWRKCYILAMRNPALRVGLQLHKIMNVR